MEYFATFLSLVGLFFISCINNKIVRKISQEKNPKSWSHPVDGTTGSPLGGVGTGAVKYCAWTGILNAFTDMTPAGMQRYNKHVTLGEDARFQFKSNREGIKITKAFVSILLINRI